MIGMTRALLVASVLVVPHVAHAKADAAPDGTALLMQLVAQSDDAELQLDVLRGVHAAVEGRRDIGAPQGWPDVYAKLGRAKDVELRSLARGLAAIYGDRNAIADMRRTLEDAAADMNERRSVLQSLLAAGEPTLAKTLQQLISDTGLREAALAGLAAYDDLETPKVVLAAYAKFDISARRVALNTLAGRLDYARPLAAAVKSGAVPRQDLTAFTIRQLRDLGDAGLNAFVDEVYGLARDTSADKAAQIARYKEWLTDGRLANANPSRGRVVFTKTCAQCHALYGAGGTVGPDLTGSQRQPRLHPPERRRPRRPDFQGVPGHADPDQGQARRLGHRDRDRPRLQGRQRDRNGDGAEGAGRQGQEERPFDDARGIAERVERDRGRGPHRVPEDDEPGAVARRCALSNPSFRRIRAADAFGTRGSAPLRGRGRGRGRGETVRRFGELDGGQASARLTAPFVFSSPVFATSSGSCL